MNERADDLEKLAGYATALADAIEAALPGWIERCVTERLDHESDAAKTAGRIARSEIGPELRRLLATDIDDQWTNPLDLLRRAVRYPTEVLRTAGFPPATRDEFAEKMFPDDVYDLTPTSFAEVDPALHEPGLVWGAAKAHVHLARRRDLGQD